MLVVVLVACSLQVEGKVWKPSGKIRGRKPSPNKCNKVKDSECCVERQLYTTYNCSPPVPSECDKNSTLMTCQLWHYPPVGLTKRIGASTILPLGAVGAVWWPWLWMSVTPQWVAMKSMTNKLHVITLLMPPWPCGKPWACQAMTRVV